MGPGIVVLAKKRRLADLTLNKLPFKLNVLQYAAKSINPCSDDSPSVKIIPAIQACAVL